MEIGQAAAILHSTAEYEGGAKSFLQALGLTEEMANALPAEAYMDKFRLLYTLTGAAGEIGEAENIFKKWLRGDERYTDFEVTKRAVIAEVRDALWYIFEMLTVCGNGAESEILELVVKLGERKSLNLIKGSDSETPVIPSVQQSPEHILLTALVEGGGKLRYGEVNCSSDVLASMRDRGLVLLSLNNVVLTRAGWEALQQSNA